MILKVQIALHASGGTSWMLVYNKDQTYIFEGPATQAVLRAMDGEAKRYFDAELDPHRRFVLVETVPGQGW